MCPRTSWETRSVRFPQVRHDPQAARAIRTLVAGLRRFAARTTSVAMAPGRGRSKRVQLDGAGGPRIDDREVVRPALPLRAGTDRVTTLIDPFARVSFGPRADLTLRVRNATNERYVGWARRPARTTTPRAWPLLVRSSTLAAYSFRNVARDARPRYEVGPVECRRRWTESCREPCDWSHS